MLSSATPAATETELAVGKAQEGALAAGKPQSYALMLNAWDFVEVELEPHGAELVIIAYDPSGSKARGAKLGPDGGKIAFVAEATGRYRLEVTPGEKAKEGTYTITLDKIVTLADRLAPATAKYESPRIKILRAAVESGKRGSAAAFWDEVKKKGAPLIEPLQGDEKNMLVTFLWKGTPGTQNVFVLWFPFTDGPDDYHMTRLGETDVWYKTVKVDKRKRFMYRLAPNIPRPRGAPEGPNDDECLVRACT